MKESLQNIGDLIAEPSSRVFERLKSQPEVGHSICCFLFIFSSRMLWAVASVL